MQYNNNYLSHRRHKYLKKSSKTENGVITMNNKKQMTWAEYTDAQKAYEKAKNDYNRTPMGITENAVNKGKEFVDKLFNKK